jgi:dolichyl-phosphate-mannose-protein mannosyltransferase
VTAACSFLALGWFFNLVPYVAVKRQAFVYHYMPALVFAQLLVTVLVEGVVPPSWHRVTFWLLALPAVATFVFYMPWIYSLPLHPEGHEMRRWLPTWD